MHGRSVMLSQTAHQRVLFGVCGPPGCTSRVSGLLLLATPFISPVPARHSHAAGPAVRIPCLCMRSPCPLSSPSLDFSPIAFRPASCGAHLAPHATFCRASRLRRVPVPGWPAAVTFLLCLRPRLLPSVPRTPRPCTSESRWVDTGQRPRTPTNRCL